MDQQPPQAPEPAQEPNTKPPVSRKRRILLIAGTVGAAIIIVGLAAALLSGDEPKNTPSTGQTPPAQNQLKPASEIKVGTFRYKSPCQVLPLTTVTKVMGKMSADGYMSEDSLSTSYSGDDPARTQCYYVINRESDLSVELSADQYTDISDIKRVRSLFLAVPTELERQIAKYRQTADQSGNQAAKAYVSKLEKSLDTYKKIAGVTDADELSKLNPSGLALPGFVDQVGYIQDNVYFAINVAGYDSSNLTAEQMATLNGLLTAVASNARNERLDQSPAPTLLNKTTKAGSTKLLEPCTILTNANFATLTGNQENDLLSRLSLRAQPATELKRTDGSLILPTNICERTARLADSSRISVELQILYASSSSGAQAEYAKYNNNGSAEAALQTSADEAKRVGADTTGAGRSSYIFRVGPYFASVTISNVARGNTTYGTQDQHVTAINLLSERLKSADR